MDQNNNFDTALSRLKEKNESRTVDIWLPSLKRGGIFKRLNLNQQKQLIRTSINENVLKLDFNISMYDIIKQNCVSEDVIVDELTVIDMWSIGLAYRCHDIGADYGFYIEEKFYPVDLQKAVDNIRTVDFKEVFTDLEFADEGVVVTLGVPTIKVDRDISELLRKEYDKRLTNDNALQEILADLYIHEASKYIKSLTLISENDDPDNPPVSLDLHQTTPAQRMLAMESVPLKSVNRVSEISDQVQALEKKILNVLLDGRPVKIEINSTFFT